ncbi:MAG: FAD-binding protein [Acidimicrobiales bacterium]
MGRELLAGWGGTAPSAAEVTRPADADGVRRVVAGAGTRGVIARGLGRSYGDAAQNGGGTVVATPGLDHMAWADEAEGLVRVAAGTSLDALLRLVVPRGWFVPVTPGTRQVTVGGAIAADIHGKNHHFDGSIARHVTSLTLATADGVATVSPESDADIFWATAGGLGLTGIVLEATIRLLAVRTSWVRVVTERAPDLGDLMARMDRRDADHRYSVAWVDGLAGGRHAGRGVITWGDHAQPADLDAARPARARPARARPGAGAGPLAFEPPAGISLPPLVPPGLLNHLSIGALNEVWFRRAPAAPTITVEPLAGFFHPLDAVAGWNRLYGRRGFVQHQFVVPFGAEAVVARSLTRLRAAGCPPFLAVLKRFGAATPGPLSFPMPGWTLALDLPVGAPGLAAALDDLDDDVAGAGGRVYLAKDARLRPELLDAMYPGLHRWRETKARVDPDGVFTSDLGRRLGLSGPARGAA